MSEERVVAFYDLIVWQKAHRLMLDVYEFTKLLPESEKYNRITQLKRAVSSIPANIAEGFGRFHYLENVQFCRQGRGSVEEVANHIIAARDLKQAPEDKRAKLLEECAEVRLLLNSYIRATLNRKRSST